MRQLIKKFHWYRYEILLGLSAVLAYAPAIHWGLPQATGPALDHPWGHDDIAPLGPLAEIHNTFIEAKADRFLAYPLLHYFIVATAYFPYVLYLFLTGKMVTPSSTYPYGLSDPVQVLQVLSLIARSVTVLMAAGTVVSAYQLAKSMWDRTSGLLAAIFVMSLYPMFYYSRTGNVDVPALFWGALGLLVYARILKFGYTVRRGIWLGIFAAMSAGTKDQGAALFLLMPLLLLPLHFYSWKKATFQGERTGLWMAPAATVCAGLAAYLLSSGFIFRPERYIAHVAWILGFRADSTVYFGHPPTWDGYLALLSEIGAWLIISMSGPLFVVALFGVLFAWQRDRSALGLLLPAISLLVIIILPNRYVELRFLMPVAFILACFAGFGTAIAIRLQQKTLQLFAILAAIGFCVLPFLRGLDLTYAMLHDSRYEAGEWLNRHAAAGNRLGYFGPTQKLPRVNQNLELVRLVQYTGLSPNLTYNVADIAEMARRITDQAPEFVIVIPEFRYKQFPFGTTCPPELYELLANGSLGYKLIAFFETPSLLSWVRRPTLLGYPVVNPPVRIFAKTLRLPRSSTIESESFGAGSLAVGPYRDGLAMQIYY